jgi:hypothetical protein
MAQDNAAKQDSPPGTTPTYATEPLVCRTCGAVTTPRITPETGPYDLKSNCPYCGAFLKWLSRLTPEERARRQAQARLDAMAQLAPTAPQLAYLQALGDTRPAPANRAEASQRIDQLQHESGVA